jgi:hypothetical protein
MNFFMKIMKSKGYDTLGAFDLVFFCDHPENNSNILGALYFDQFNFEDMKKYLHAKTENLHKCRSKIEIKFGMHWYKKMG